MTLKYDKNSHNIWLILEIDQYIMEYLCYEYGISYTMEDIMTFQGSEDNSMYYGMYVVDDLDDRNTLFELFMTAEGNGIESYEDSFNN